MYTAQNLFPQVRFLRTADADCDLLRLVEHVVAARLARSSTLLRALRVHSMDRRDLQQTVHLKLCQFASDSVEVQALVPLIVVLVRHLADDLTDRSACRPDPDSDCHMDTLDLTPDPEAIVASRQLLGQVAEAIRRLTPARRRALETVILGEGPVTATTRQALARARRDLQTALAPHARPAWPAASGGRQAKCNVVRSDPHARCGSTGGMPDPSDPATLDTAGPLPSPAREVRQLTAHRRRHAPAERHDIPRGEFAKGEPLPDRLSSGIHVKSSAPTARGLHII